MSGVVIRIKGAHSQDWTKSWGRVVLGSKLFQGTQKCIENEPKPCS